MSQRRKTGTQDSEQAMRDQEVLRANRELAAYFKGRRTEREARAALKIIKAFVRDRERRDAKTRPPLPRSRMATMPEPATSKAANAGGKPRIRKVEALVNREVPLPSNEPAQSDTGLVGSTHNQQTAPSRNSTPVR